MKNNSSYRSTTKMRLKEIAEAKKINEVLVKHYTFILTHFEEVIAKHDDAIAEIEAEKEEVLSQFIKAPQLLKELAQGIAQLQQTKRDVTNRNTKVKKLRNLRERYEALKHQIIFDGINIEETEKNIEALEKEKAAKVVDVKATAAEAAADLI